MKPSVLMTALKDRLEAWRDADAQRRQFTVELARDIQHALGLLEDSKSRPIVVIAWGGEDAQGADLEDANLATQSVSVFLGWNPGIGSGRMADTLTLHDTARDLKNVCLGLDTAPGEDHGCLSAQGIQPAELPGGYPLAAYRIRLELDDDGGEIITELEPEP